MKKTFLAISLAFTLTACSPSVRTPPDFPELLKQTSGFEDCKIAQLQNSLGTVLYVVRCPNSDTGVNRPGKSPMNSEVIEGNTQ